MSKIIVQMKIKKLFTVFDKGMNQAFHFFFLFKVYAEFVSTLDFKKINKMSLNIYWNSKQFITYHINDQLSFDFLPFCFFL